MQNIITFHRSAFQYGVEFSTKEYIEKYSNLNGHIMFYYQFMISDETDYIPIVPDCCIDLFFSCNHTSPLTLLYGPVLQGTPIKFQANTLYFAVRLTPRQSVNLKLFRDVVNSYLHLTDASEDYIDKCIILSQTQGFEEKITFFEKQIFPELLQNCTQTSKQIIHYALEKLYQSGGNISIKELSKDVGYSERYVRHHFVDHLGISPKLFSRIIRFQNSLAQLLHSNFSIDELASRNSFYDQSHFFKEFKEFSLTSPGQIRKTIGVGTFPRPEI